MFTMSRPEQFTEAGKAFLETQFSLLHDLGGKTLASASQLAELNVAAARACAEDSFAQVQQLHTLADARNLLDQSVAQASVGAEKVASYSRHVAGIASGLQAHYFSAVQEQYKQAQAKINELIDEAAKKAPAGSEHVAAFVKTALDTGNAGAEQLARSAREGAHAIEEQLAKVSGQFIDAMKSGQRS